MTPPRLTQLEVGDPAWDHATAGLPVQPYCDRTYLAAVAAHDDTRPVLLAAKGDGWSAVYVLVLQGLGDGRWMARTPEYGGPLLQATVPVEQAATELRCGIDSYLVELGVIGEVILLDPWVPNRRQIADTWSCSREKDICLTPLTGADPPWARLRRDRRSDIARARLETDVSCRPLTKEGGQWFASVYADAMDRLGASPRWRFGPAYFDALADYAADRFTLVESRSQAGGAATLMLRVGDRAAYYLAARWGRQRGAPSLALWQALEHLGTLGVAEVLLGGGPSSDPADSLLDFKRSFASRSVPLFLGGRVYDSPAMAVALREERVRPLPACSLEVGDTHSGRS